jgi:uncharacterized membrane-anchored protein YjiN (DUF445 family)
MVGAIADWFAVTALFRYPLGLPIPHTAIIPNKQDRIAEALGSFVTNNFLQPEILEEKLANLKLDERMADWVSQPANRAMLTDQIAGFAPNLFNLLDRPETRQFLDQNILKRINGEKIAPALGQFLTEIAKDKKADELISGVFNFIAQMLDKNQDAVVRAIRDNIPKILFGLLNPAIAKRVAEGIEKTLVDVARDPNHPLRAKIKTDLVKWAEAQQNNPEFQQNINKLKDNILNDPKVVEFLERQWLEIKEDILGKLADPESELRHSIDQSVHSLVNLILRDDKLRAKIVGGIYRGTLSLVSQNREAVGKFIADTIKRWDRETLISRLEIQVGRDLQYIRINGTLVGGTVGLLLHAISHWL